MLFHLWKSIFTVKKMKVRKLLLIIFTIVISMHVHAAKEVTGTHMFGFAASFNDSTIYITEIQYVDSAYIGKSNFLFSRENYSYQLQNYLRSIGAVTPTCITTFAKDQKRIEKNIFPCGRNMRRVESIPSNILQQQTSGIRA